MDNIIVSFNRLLEIQKRFLKGIKYTSYFTTKQWTFCRKKAAILSSILPSNEIEAHPMDPSVINWGEYFEICVLGTRKYFHKESETITEKVSGQMSR